MFLRRDRLLDRRNLLQRGFHIRPVPATFRIRRPSRPASLVSNSSTDFLRPSAVACATRNCASRSSKRDVARDHGRNQGQGYAAARFLGRQQIGARRFGFAPDPAPQVDFPAGRQEGAETSCSAGRQYRGSSVRSLAIGCRSGHSQSAASLGSRAGKDCGELVDARGRDPQVAVVGQRFVDEAIQIRVAICIPPGRLLQPRRASRFAEPVGRGDLDRRLDVVGTLDAAADKAGRASQCNQKFDVSVHRAERLMRTMRRR